MFSFKFDFDGKHVQTIRLLINILAIDFFSQSIDEHYDGETVITTEADVFIGTDMFFYLG